MTKIKIHPSFFFLKFVMKKLRCVLWAGKYGICDFFLLVFNCYSQQLATLNMEKNLNNFCSSSLSLAAIGFL